MFASNTPMTIKRISQPLDVPFPLARLTIQMVTSATRKTIMKYASVPQPRRSTCTMFAPLRTENTTQTSEAIRMIQLKMEDFMALER